MYTCNFSILFSVSTIFLNFVAETKTKAFSLDSVRTKFKILRVLWAELSSKLQLLGCVTKTKTVVGYVLSE